MASFEGSYEKYFGEKITHLSKETTEEEIKDLYKNWAADYDKDKQNARAVYHKPLAEFLDVAIKQVYHDQDKSHIRIIDAGAGTGLAGVELSKLGYTNIDALDISQEMLNEADRKNVYTKLICAPLNEERNPEIETGGYHVLICTGTLVIAHVRPEALHEMIRMVKTGGLFCFSMRDDDFKEYESKLLELEMTEKWQIFSKKRIPHFDVDDMPREKNAFIYRVLKR